MTLRHFQIFVTVYEIGNFTKAGKILCIAQPAVSLAIKELEQYYGVLLFDRIKHSIRPTKYGQELYYKAKTIVELFEDAHDLSKQWNNKVPIVIGSTNTIGNQILPQLIHEFQLMHPDILIKVVINNVMSLEKSLEQNEIDIALIETSPSNTNFKSIPFLQDHLVTLAWSNHHLSKKKNIAIEDLSHENILTRERGSSVRELVESIFLTYQVHFNPVWVSTSTQALIGAVEQKLGITTLPYQLVKKRYDIDKISLLDVPQLNVKRTYHVIYYKDKRLCEKMNDFIKLCQQFEYYRDMD